MIAVFRRRIGFAFAVALLLVAGAIEHPRADFQLLMHDSSDHTPSRLQAALDLGVVAFSVLITWTHHLT